MARKPASARRRKRRRSLYEVKTWICPNCKLDVKPILCELVNIPNLQCPQCGQKENVTFDFNILRFHRNGVSLRTKVYDQGTVGLCSLYSTKTQAEIKLRIKGAKEGWFIDDTLDNDSILVEYERLTGCVFGKEKIGERGRIRAKRMLETLKRGVKLKCSYRNSATTDQMFNIKDFSSTSKDDFSEICKLLANGEPLTGAFYVGQNFSDLEGNKVYKSPNYDRMCNETQQFPCHAVCIVGAGARWEKKKYVRYLWFRNSFGKTFGRKGDGMVRFEDLIFDPYVMSFL